MRFGRVSLDAAFVRLHVEGNPIPQGSHRAFVTRTGKPYITDDNAMLSAWKQSIHWHAYNAMGSKKPSQLPIELEIDFVVPVPRSREGQLWPKEHGTGDLDKLTRATLDGMEGKVYLNDAQVVRITTSKRYSDPSRPPGVTITVFEINDT